MSQTRVFPRIAVPGPARPVLAILCLAAALASWALSGSRLAAAPLPPDPVEKFRDLLKADTGLVDSPRGLAARRKKLTDQINALADLGDMARILLLREWRTDETEALTRGEVYKIDTAARNLLMKRFEEGVKGIVARGTYAEQAAVAFLVGETATKVRSLVV